MPLSQATLNKYRQDALYQNQWRYETATALDYMDGNQFPAQLAEKMREKGLPLIPVNICKGTVDTACGLLERSQTDVIVSPEDDEQQDISDVLTFQLKEAERETMGDRACLDAARVMFGGGIGWIEVRRVDDPFASTKYSIEGIPYTEMFADPRSSRVDYHDAEYLRRLKFFEKEVILRMFPVLNEAGVSSSSDTNFGMYEPQKYQRNEWQRDDTLVSLDLWGLNREMVALEEIQYRETVNTHCFQLSSGRWMAFDPQNPMHVQAHEEGAVQVVVKPVSQVRQAMYVGNVCLFDRPSPAGHNRFTYIPFVFERETRTGVPFGVLRSIIALQDEVNTRRAKAVYALLSTKTIVSQDAVDDLNILREEIGRRNSMIVLGKNYKNGISKLEVSDGIQMSGEQLRFANEAMDLAPSISGVPLSIRGAQDGSADSGVAINALADYGANSLSRVMAHFKEARRKVYDVLLQYIIEDVGQSQKTLKGTDTDGKPLAVDVNVPTNDDSGAQFIDNNLSAMRLKVVLDDVPHSATHRQEQLKIFMKGLEGTPPEIQALALPFVAKLLDIPEKDKMELVAALRRQLGLSDDPSSPEAQQIAQQKQAQAQDQQAKDEQLHQMALATAAANLRTANANASKAEAASVKDEASTRKIQVETALLASGMA